MKNNWTVRVKILILYVRVFLKTSNGRFEHHLLENYAKCWQDCFRSNKQNDHLRNLQVNSLKKDAHFWFNGFVKYQNWKSARSNAYSSIASVWINCLVCISCWTLLFFNGACNYVAVNGTRYHSMLIGFVSSTFDVLD